MPGGASVNGRSSFRWWSSLSSLHRWWTLTRRILGCPRRSYSCSASGSSLVRSPFRSTTGGVLPARHMSAGETPPFARSASSSSRTEASADRCGPSYVPRALSQDQHARAGPLQSPANSRDNGREQAMSSRLLPLINGTRRCPIRILSAPPRTDASN